MAESSRRIRGGITSVAIAALAVAGCTYSSGESLTAPTSTPAPLTATPISGPAPTPTTPTLTIEIQTPTPEPEPTSGPDNLQVVGVPEYLNVRSGPGTANPIVATIDLGDTVVATGAITDVDGSPWHEVIVGDETGWVFGGFVAASGAPTPTALPTPTPGGTPTPPDGTPTPLPVAAAGDRVVAAPLGLNVRSGPSTADSIIGELDEGDVVTLTGEASGDGAWVEIDSAAGRGWVSARWLENP